MRILLSLLLVAATTSTAADERFVCGTSDANDAYLRALHERNQARHGLIEDAVATPVLTREGAFYIQRDDKLVPGYRPFDLEGQSLVFEPSGSGYKVRREALRWVEPTGEPLRDFAAPNNPVPAGYVKYDITGTLPQLFGQSVSSIYISAFNGIHLVPPKESSAYEIDALEAAVYPDAVVSPLLLTNRKPTRLASPLLFVNRDGGNVIVTWRSTTGVSFGYDVQAELHPDGSIVFSYREMRDIRWGTPIVSRGFDASPITRVLGGADDARADLVAGLSPSTLTDANDIRRVEVSRVNESNLFVVRMTLNGPVNYASLPVGTTLRYVTQVGSLTAWLDVDRDGWTLTPFGANSSIRNGGDARVSGNVVEFYGVQASSDDAVTNLLRAWTLQPSTNRTIDFATTPLPVAFDVPQKQIATDLSNIGSVELQLPITEPFVLGTFDPAAVWDRMQKAYGISSYDYDGIAMYQSFYTDLIFYAGAYSTGGNPGVDGIAPPSQTRSSTVPRAPALLHMNQLTYGWNATTKNASNVILHELGHRWLYFFRILEGGAPTRSLNPVSAHPAGFVSTPAAFKVFEDGESSVMGGGTFNLQSGHFVAHTQNNGYSWTDLYLMGLAAPEEIPPWYYISNTSPALPSEYWPAEGASVTGTRRDVTINQIIGAEGTRSPSTALSQRLFRVLFVLVTDGAEPTPIEIAKINQWRGILETNFAIATGQRGRVETEYVTVPKKRAARH
jgi:hypothetical protein